MPAPAIGRVVNPDGACRDCQTRQQRNGETLSTQVTHRQSGPSRAAFDEVERFVVAVREGGDAALWRDVEVKTGTAGT